MTEDKIYKLGKMGSELHSESYALHKEGCPKGAHLNSKVAIPMEEWEAVKLDPECLGCNAYNTGLDLMRLLGPKGFYQIQGVDDDAGED